MNWVKRKSTRRQRALRWLVAAPLIVVLSWYGAGYHLTPWGAGLQAMDRAAVGKTEPLTELGKIGYAERERWAFFRVNEKAMVFYTVYDVDGFFGGWKNNGAYVLDVREGKCPICVANVDRNAGYEWGGPGILYGRVNDPEIDHVELWWWDWGENWETCGGPALRIDRSEFLYQDGESYLVWHGELPPYGKLDFKCYSKENKLLHQERVDPFYFY